MNDIYGEMWLLSQKITFVYKKSFFKNIQSDNINEIKVNFHDSFLKHIGVLYKEHFVIISN